MNLDNDESYKMVTLQGRMQFTGEYAWQSCVLYPIHREVLTSGGGPHIYKHTSPAQHRALATQLQKQGDCEQPQSREELTQLKWLQSGTKVLRKVLKTGLLLANRLFV